MNNTIKAPQTALKSSWVSETFTKSKKPSTTVITSRGRTPQTLVYSKGSVIKSGCPNHSNLY